MIQPIDTKLKSTRVMNESELAEPGSRGWTLIAVVQESVLIPANSSCQCPGPTDGSLYCSHGVDYGQGHCMATDYYNMPVTVSRTRYLMGRDEETVIGDLSKQIEQLQERDSKMLADLNDKQKSVDAMHARNATLMDEQAAWKRCDDNQRDKIGKQDDQVVAQQQTINKMEADLAKVRTYFGTVEFNKSIEKDTNK